MGWSYEDSDEFFGSRHRGTVSRRCQFENSGGVFQKMCLKPDLIALEPRNGW